MPNTSESANNQKIYMIVRVEDVRGDRDFFPYESSYTNLEAAKKACEEEMEKFKQHDIKGGYTIPTHGWEINPNASQSKSETFPVVLNYGGPDHIFIINWEITETTLVS